MNGAYLSLATGGGGSGLRPAPIPHGPITPFDPSPASPSGNLVHTTLPPEQVIPPHFSDPKWLRADFNGVTLPGAYSGSIASGGWTITSGRWQGLVIPYLAGANSTPPTMIMTPMLHGYPADVQHAVFTEHAERAYDDFIWDVEGWNLPPLSIDQALAWQATIQSWGFRSVLWRGNPPFSGPVDDLFNQLAGAGLSAYVHGEEADSKTSAEIYEQGIQLLLGWLAKTRSLPVFAHFTAEPMPPAGRGMGYPLGFPRDTFLLDWSKYDGLLHLALQLNVAGDAGLQGSGTWYARRRLMGVGDGAQGSGAPHSVVCNFETTAFAQLAGACTESYGCLRDWECLCGTRDGTTSPAGLLIPPPAGFGNGNRYPNGDPL